MVLISNIGTLIIIIVAAKVLAHVLFPNSNEQLVDCHE